MLSGHGGGLRKNPGPDSNSNRHLSFSQRACNHSFHLVPLGSSNRFQLTLQARLIPKYPLSHSLIGPPGDASHQIYWKKSRTSHTINRTCSVMLERSPHKGTRNVTSRRHARLQQHSIAGKQLLSRQANRNLLKCSTKDAEQQHSSAPTDAYQITLPLARKPVGSRSTGQGMGRKRLQGTKRIYAQLFKTQGKARIR